MKKTIQLNETELVELLKRLINESKITPSMKLRKKDITKSSSQKKKK